ncbi:ribonuclease R [bacterium]|nr:ribonuclease R [bacterium]
MKTDANTPKLRRKEFSKNEILDFLVSQSPQTYKSKEIAKKLKLSNLIYMDFKKQLKSLVAKGKVVRYPKGRFGVAQTTKELQGILHVKTQGYGFVLLETGGDDIFVSLKNMDTALHGDRVAVELMAQSRGHHSEGTVIKVLERARSSIVGTYRRGKRTGFVVPDNVKIVRDIYIPQEDSLKAKNGQKVVVEIREWVHSNLNPEGAIVEVLGFPDEKGVALEAVVRSFELTSTFPPKVDREASAIKTEIPAELIAQRLDLRDEVVFTIDPADSKDFDDAVSLFRLDNGNYKLGVHIADVSHYVQPGTEIDKEAIRRGTSVYLVDRVIPMLPERLSNQICSLEPHKERLAFSIIMEVTPKGSVVSFEIHETVILSKRRFTYQEVQAILDDPKSTEKYVDTLREMHQLSQVLLRQRVQNGSLSFDLPEAYIELDDSGQPVDIRPRERLDSHRLVEEFMLLANQTVAASVKAPTPDDPARPFVYRVHERPSVEKVKNFTDFVQGLGLTISEKQVRRPASLQRFLNSVEDEQKRKIVNKVLLRSLMKAKYTTKNEGHFGLAFQNYTHFTSPIRRYPDLIVHRLIKNMLGLPHAKNWQVVSKKLEEQCKAVTQCEIKALEAERASVKMMQLEFIEKHLGEVFEGVIAGVVVFGLFVEIPEFLIEGLVHVNELEKDFFVFDDRHLQLIGQNTGKIYRLGDKLRVRVARVAKNERLIDFTLEEQFRSPKRRPRKGK